MTHSLIIFTPSKQMKPEKAPARLVRNTVDGINRNINTSGSGQPRCWPRTAGQRAAGP